MADRDDDISRDSLSENSDSGEFRQNANDTPQNETLDDSIDDVTNHKDESVTKSETANAVSQLDVSPETDTVSDTRKEQDTHTSSSPPHAATVPTSDESGDKANAKSSSDVTFDESVLFEEAVSVQPNSGRKKGGRPFCFWRCLVSIESACSCNQ